MTTTVHASTSQTAPGTAAPGTTAPAAGTPALPVHPRRGGWRAGAASALLSFAVSELQAGRSPQHDVLALARLGGGDLAPGLAAAQELDRRLAAALAHLTDDLLLHRARSAAFDGPAAATGLLPEELADVVVGTLFDALPAPAVSGRPHPGEWVASSVDVVPCAVHGYEDGPVDCLRRAVRTQLASVVDRVAGVPAGTATLAEQVRATPSPTYEHGDAGDRGPAGRGPGDHDHVLAALWTGVAALAAWQAHAATR